MKINRHNYEEYFILYADKELSSDDRRMVEEFVSLNPDLKDELEVYNNAILLPDTSVEFENKEELQHHDESLISYIDDELPVHERVQLEKLISTSPKLQQELELYRKTKLQPDTNIVFENKSVLYRSTERRRVISLTIIRWSVAAAVLLAIAITAVNIFNRKPVETGVAVANPKNDNTVTTTPNPNSTTGNPSTEKKSDEIDKKDQQELIQKNNNSQNNIAHVVTKAKLVLRNEVKERQIQEKKNDNIVAANQQPGSNNLPKPLNNPTINNSKQSSDPLAVNTNEKAQDGVTISDNNPYNNQKTGSNQTNNADLVKETLPPGERIIEEGGQNKKSRGFFRKLTRVFEKNTGIKATDDEDKLHFAAFTVKLK